eukprot:m.66389 g.66389  ORF g.66389 m.66389 type:complete len:435 (+) comp13748_c0_seq2:447-1751(+)
MASLNINRNVDDAFYRYKMPPILAKVEGKGNGIKTVIPNMVEVAKALSRPPEYPTKFFGCELGAQTIMDAKNERYIVNGAFDAPRLQDLLDGFIQKFVLCPACDNPETNLRVTSKKTIEQTCLACGHRGFLPMNHRLTTYILNHPPGGDNKKQGKMTKEERRAAKRAKQQQQQQNSDDAEAPTPEAEEDDDVEWSEDTSEAAMAERQRKELTAAAASLTMSDDLEKPLLERLEMFHGYVEEQSKKKPFPSKEVLAEGERLDCKEKGVMILVEFLWTSQSAEDLMRNMKENRGLVQRFVFENKKAQKYLLGALEKTIALNESVLLPKVAHLLKYAYDLDLVEEDAFASWGEKPSKKYVNKDLSTKIRQKAKPFLDWLQEADEESSEEEEEEDDVAFDDRATKAGLVTAASSSSTASTAAAEEEEDDDDDIDIDDI